MATITADNIASVSLKDADRDPAGFAHKLGKSFEEYGFAIIADHGIPDELIHRAEDKAKAFFALPDEVKRKYKVAGGGGARGYTPFGIETAKGGKAHDLKEFWHVGRDLPRGHRFRDHMPDNVWPSEVPELQGYVQELYATFDRTGLKILQGDRALPQHRRGLFRGPVNDGNSVLRAAPLSAAERADRRAYPRRRARGHQRDHPSARRRGSGAGAPDPRRALDSGLTQVGRAGRQHRRHAAAADQRRLRSTSHRVVNPRARSRRPRALLDAVLPALPLGLPDRRAARTVPAGEQPKWPPITANDYLQERLREIKLV